MCIRDCCGAMMIVRDFIIFTENLPRRRTPRCGEQTLRFRNKTNSVQQYYDVLL